MDFSSFDFSIAEIIRFGSVYLLLIIVLIIMKKPM